MTIYVLRSDNLIKIGFTENLRQRVQGIIASVPIPVEFVGHMPGDRTLEAHLHERFKSERFSGEWFVETREMRIAFDAVLTPRLPERPHTKAATKRAATRDDVDRISALFRRETERRWPELDKAGRIAALADVLGWNRNRVKDLYYADQRLVVRAYEVEQVDALFIAPELRSE